MRKQLKIEVQVLKNSKAYCAQISFLILIAEVFPFLVSIRLCFISKFLSCLIYLLLEGNLIVCTKLFSRSWNGRKKFRGRIKFYFYKFRS